MFFQYIKKQWCQGIIKVGLPATGHGGRVSVEAIKFLPEIATFFLTKKEKEQLVGMAKKDALKKKSELATE